ncbi:MAG: ABC-F family ATP-binding cassette domain-containing protein, partial [Candidatus Jacksonbacteria bacterium]|nr:ABC-F family ATP-binding cassette domain-containing protein [Candidatus Jacksonbacteria bacterium]
MSNNSVVLRFSDVNFAFDRKAIFDEVNFSVRDNSKIALMGQNGAGKSTLFKMVTGELKPDEGGVFVTPAESTVAVSKQVMDPKYLDGTVREYFESAFNEKKYELDKLIKDVFEVVNIDIDVTKKVRELSGGQQARMLLAHALIQSPDILLLDEPTNNLDQEGIGHLTAFLVMYPKTCIVISHDAEFLNVFTDGVLYLDAFMRKVEQYTGNYHDVVEEITARVKKEQLLNVRAEKDIKRLKAQAGVFAHKGGKLRGVAKKMREAAAEAEEGKVDVR